MSNITVTYRDGRVAQLEQVYIRGSKIRFLILPDMLKNAPMLKSMKNKNQGSGAGRGKAAILKAQVAARGRGRGMGGGGFIVFKILGDWWLTTDIQASAVSLFTVGSK
ncbi:small nuclear ribonucleoprotein Sm D3 [Grammomys surdaster]|uniref:small nuclear ribonucleoprotein Sm D3 n=1 Tax=Grammomys surdaster TaxID=491861 RepID=UPI0010A0394F|nr:small nuclear ribonucleoprotein Sm D3 [Grammomys surdaster]